MDYNKVSFKKGFSIKVEKQSEFGLVSFTECVISSDDLNKVISNIVLRNDNLSMAFDMELNDNNLYTMLSRFIPDEVVTDLDKYVDGNLNKDNNFYSFLAEDILGLVLNKLYGYSLVRALLSTEDTISNIHNGVDAVLFDEKSEFFAIGEAKFYSKTDSFKRALSSIKNAFTSESGYKSKFSNLLRIIKSKTSVRDIFVKQIGKPISTIKLSDFGNVKLIIGGLIMHEDNSFNDAKYAEKDFYNWNIDIESISKAMQKYLGIEKVDVDKLQLIIVHLPVVSKKDLIVKVIESAESRVKDLNYD